MKTSRIHALQSSTSSHKLLQSVRSLRPLLCEALRAGGCDTIDINEQDPTLHVESVQNEVSQGLNSQTSGQHHRVHAAQFVHVEELANLPSYSSSDGHQLHDLAVDAEYQYGHKHEDLHAQQCNPWHVAPLSHNDAHDGDAVQSFADVQRHVYRQHRDAHNHGQGKYFSTENGQYYSNEQHGDALHHLYNEHWHHCDAHHYEHRHEYGYNAISMFVSTDSPKLLGMQKDQEQIVQMSFRHLFPMTIESPVNIHPYGTLSCPQYPQADNHLLDYQHIHAYHNYPLQQHNPLEITPFVNTLFFEAPGSIINDTLIGDDATSESNNINECIRAQELPRYGMNNVKVHEVHTGHQANGSKVLPLPELCKHKEKLLTTISNQLESSDESEGTDSEEGAKLLSPKDKAATSITNLLSERRRRKKWNEALYALRALVPIVSKMDKLSVVGDTLTYLHQLRDKVDNLQNDISSLQAEKEALACSQEGLFTCTGQEIKSCKDSDLKYKISELDVHVVDMEQKTYHLCICCEREDGVLLELTKALEALNFNMLNASIRAMNGIQVLFTAVVKVDAEVLTPEVLKESILQSATMYGFHL